MGKKPWLCKRPYCQEDASKASALGECFDCMKLCKNAFCNNPIQRCAFNPLRLCVDCYDAYVEFVPEGAALFNRHMSPYKTLHITFKDE